MKARCVTCEQTVEIPDGAFYFLDEELLCPCPGGSACQGDDLRADDAYNDPRTGQASEINRRMKR